MNAVLSDTIFDANPSGHGGNHRTAQIHEIAASAGLEVVAINRSAPTQGLARYAQGAAFLGRHRRYFLPAQFRSLREWRAAHAIYHAGLANHRGAKVLIWEATHRKNWVAPHVARELGFKVIAVPQNLETMVPEVGHESARIDEFCREAEHLSLSDALFCISREEQWILNLHGLNAQYLPYFPPRQVFENMLSIRQRRQGKQADRFVILGSAYNPPTRAGMEIQLDWCRQLSGGAQVEVAGYGTECLREQGGSRGITVHGSLEQRKLEELLVQTKAIWVHQPAATGILTRVTEMLTAGIPVIGNSVATRSVYHLPGVYSYETQDELQDLLKLDFPPPPIPTKPERAERRAVDVFREFAERSTSR